MTDAEIVKLLVRQILDAVTRNEGEFPQEFTADEYQIRALVRHEARPETDATAPLAELLPIRVLGVSLVPREQAEDTRPAEAWVEHPWHWVFNVLDRKFAIAVWKDGAWSIPGGEAPAAAYALGWRWFAQAVPPDKPAAGSVFSDEMADPIDEGKSGSARMKA